MPYFRRARYSDHLDTDALEVARTLRAIGASVEHIGRPLDQLVGYRGVTMLVEVKQPPGPRGGKSAKGQKLRATQEEFIANWRGAKPLVVTRENCVAMVLHEARRVNGGENEVAAQVSRG